ncbi:hypothetical protein IPL68_05755 [Candidatus Saccharibacteria bacterium]|nr:MAG: hypothetical protein IPL68_05755 [Candidatus Saccharibacteria bacterium]
MPADGSLYYPIEIPPLTNQQIASLPTLDNKAIDHLILKAWLGDEIPTDDLARIVDNAATFETPCVPVVDKHV